MIRYDLIGINYYYYYYIIIISSSSSSENLYYLQIYYTEDFYGQLFLVTAGWVYG